ncbi:hypothetical protein Tco_0115424, partial [Tanacetum coccineum]
MTSSHPVFPPLTGCDRLVSEPRQAYLDGTDTESKPFEDPIDTETPESPLTIAPPTSLPESTPHVLVPILHRTARMAVRVPPAMSSSLYTSIVEGPAMSKSAYRMSEEDNDKEDEEIEESLDSNSVSEDAEDEGSTVEDEDPAVGDEGLAAEVEGPSTDDESYSLDAEIRGLYDEGHSVESDGLGLEEEWEAVPEDQQQAAPIVNADVSVPLGLGYRASRRRELVLEEDQTLPSLEWTSGSLPISPSPSVVPSPVSSPMIPLTVPSHVASPATAKTKGFLTELGAQVQMHEGLIHDHAVRLEELSHALFERPVLALESWAGQTDAHRAALWHAISNMQGENRDLQLQLIEERRARLELAKVVDSMKRGREPRG